MIPMVVTEFATIMVYESVPQRGHTLINHLITAHYRSQKMLTNNWDDHIFLERICEIWALCNASEMVISPFFNSL
jgi:hypothetical protein